MICFKIQSKTRRSTFNFNAMQIFEKFIIKLKGREVTDTHIIYIVIDRERMKV